jgi:glutamate--cysteine ligase
VGTEAKSPELSPEIRGLDDLEAHFHAGAKPRSAWRVGVEYETPAVNAATGEALPYDASGACIRAILEAMADDRWSPVHENGRIIALLGVDASITLEPGGQVEMSGKQCESMHEAHDEFVDHCARLASVSKRLGVAFLGLGATPLTPLENLPWMPKQRYRIMREIMTTTGRLGHRMMQQTATVQGNFDYESEDDARRKLRVSLALSPVLVAVSANSPVIDGKDSGFKSFRAHVWTDTDARRCGLLPFAFETESIFRAYVEYALDVPMYFVAREGRLLPSDGMTFRTYLAKGLSHHRATLADWETHLTTLFPEARLKTYIEVRSADGQPQDRVIAIPTLLKGILYENDCLDAAWDLLGRWPLADRLEAATSAAKDGLAARVGRHSLQSYAREVVAIAIEGLRRQRRLDPQGLDETQYLTRLQADVDAGRCPADQALATWRDKAQSLIALAAYG